MLNPASSSAETNLLLKNGSSRDDQPINKMADVRADIDNAFDAIRQRGITSSAMGKKFVAIGDMSSRLGDQSDLYKSLWALCNKIGIFADIVDKLAVVSLSLLIVLINCSSLLIRLTHI